MGVRGWGGGALASFLMCSSLVYPLTWVKDGGWTHLLLTCLSTYPGGRTNASGILLVFEHSVLLVFVQAATNDQNNGKHCDGPCHQTDNRQNDSLLAIRQALTVGTNH